jgi:hypothetical protein
MEFANYKCTFPQIPNTRVRPLDTPFSLITLSFFAIPKFLIVSRQFKMASLDAGAKTQPMSNLVEQNKKDVSLSRMDAKGEKAELEDAHDALPSALAPIEALGIENWRELEKKLVRRLDLTMMPCLWVRCRLE